MPEPLSTHASLWHHFSAGGPIMYVLLALSIAALACAIERFANFRPRRLLSAQLATEADALWRRGAYDELVSKCRSETGPFARMVETLARNHNRPFAELSQATGDIASSFIKRQLQRSYPLAVVATLGPLIGLFGTVVGMIQAFHAIAQSDATGNAAIVAAGISTALSTTAGGLLVGIPALALRHYFSARTQSLAIDLEEQTNQLLHAWLINRNA